MRTSDFNWRSSGIWDGAMWAFCWVCFCYPSFQHSRLLFTSTVLGFLHFQLSQRELLPSWSLLCLVSASLWPSWGCFNHVTSRSQQQICPQFNFLSSVSLQQRLLTVDQCCSVVTAQSCIWQAKESTPSRCEGGPTPKERGSIWLLSLYVLSTSPESALCKLSKPRGLFIFPEVLTLVLRFSFFPFSWAFSFLCL